MDKPTHAQKGKYEKKERIRQYTSAENKKVKDTPVLKKEDVILLTYIEIIPHILGFRH